MATTDQRRVTYRDNQLQNWLERVDGRFMGAPVVCHPHEALLHCIYVTRGEADYCDEQIRKLQEDELFERPASSTMVQLPSGKWELVEEKRDPEVFSRWVSWRDSALDRLAKYSKMALDVGIEERQVQLAETQAQQLLTVIKAVLTDLGHDLKDTETRQIVRRRLLESAVVDVSGSEREVA